MGKRIILSFGQSNMVGTGLLATLQTLAASKWSSIGTYSNIFYWQNQIYSGSSITGQWTELDFATSRYDAPPANGYDYPVNYSNPQISLTPFLESFGPELEFSRGVQSTLGEPIYNMKLAYGGTYISRIEPQSTDIIQYNWFWPNAHRSWHPSLPKSNTPYVATTTLTGASPYASTATGVALTPVAGTTGTGVGVTTTPTTLVDAAAPFTPANEVGKTVRCGGNVGKITGNTGDTLTITAWYPSQPANGLAYIVYNNWVEYSSGQVFDSRTSFTLDQYQSSYIVAGGSVAQIAAHAAGNSLTLGTAWHAGTPTDNVAWAIYTNYVYATLNALVDTSAPFGAVNSKAGQWVVCGGYAGQILTNTSSALVVAAWFPVTGTFDPLASKPADNLAYTLQSRAFFSASLIKTLMEDYFSNVAAEDVVEAVVCYVGESDSIEEDRANDVYENMRAIMSYVREKITAKTGQPAEQIKWLLLGPQNDTDVWPYSDVTNRLYQQVADDDVCCKYIDPSDFDFGGFTGTDVYHHDTQGVYDLGKYLTEQWLLLQKQVQAPHVNPYESVTLGEMVTRVVRTATGNKQTNDPSTPKVKQAINNSIREICTRLGDKAWFLRRVETINMQPGSPSTILLPRQIKRLMRIECPNYPTQQIKWFGMGWENNGRMRIKLPDALSGDLNLHYLIPLFDVEADTDRLIIPIEYSELLEALACWRLSKIGRTPSGVQIDASEIQRLWELVDIDVLKYERQRQDTTELTSLYDPYSKYLAEPGSGAWL